MKAIRRLYDWILHWANTPYGGMALFLLAFAESSFFPIPPDVLLIALVIGAAHKAFKFATICTIGSLLGALLGYYLGYEVWYMQDGTTFSGFAMFFFEHIPGFTTEVFDQVKQLYNDWNFWVVFTAGFTPIPFKVFTITAGTFKISLPMFILASTISRAARFFLISWLLWKFGPQIKIFIDKYFNLLAIGFTVLLVGGFVLIKYLL